MDFFDHQARAQRNTKRLVLYFALAVAGIIAAVYLAALLVFAGLGASKSGIHPQEFWRPPILLLATGATLAVVSIGSLARIAELARGGSAVATKLGGRLVAPNTTDPDERKLLNVVEEMAIASGVPVPQVYLLENESGINAFAAGHSAGDAVIAVTRGGMTQLTRDELQGVIAHEFSHLLNGDMRLNLRLMGIIFGILCLTIIGRILLRTRGRKNPLPLFGLALILIGGIGVFFGRLIQAGVSRQREFLADASAVQFTRNPGGLAGALKKIGALGSKLDSDHAEEASHMYFGNGVGESWFGMMATHPPLEERIRAIEPNWDGTFPEVRMPPQDPRESTATPARRVPPPRLNDLIGAQAVAAGLAPGGVRADEILPRVGAPGIRQLEFAEGLRSSLPEAFKLAVREPMSACAVVYSLLLSPDEPMCVEQMRQMAARAPAGVPEEIARLRPALIALPAGARLSLIDLALPALRQLSPAEYQQFTDLLELLIASDQQVDLFEYVLRKIVIHHLDPCFKPARRPAVQFYSLRALAGDCAVLLTTLARAADGDAEQAEKAFRNGATALGTVGETLRPLLATQSGLQQLDAALNRITFAEPQIKRMILNAAAQAAAADGVVNATEAELLRAIADTLDCPLPPLVAPE